MANAKMSQNDNLKRQDSVALHEQLSAELRIEIFASYRPGDQIPTEEEIGARYKLSRVTVRRAIQTLVDQGVLVRRQGKGTFLAQYVPKVTYEIDKFGPFIDAFLSAGEAVNITVVDFNWKNDTIPEVFRDTTDRVLCYSRLYKTRGTHHAVIQVTLPPELGERISRADTASMGIYELLSTKLGVEPFRADFEISSQLPSDALCQWLRISSNTPILALERTSYDRNNKAIEQTVHYLIPAAYRIKTSAFKKTTSV
ncbi:GntR family transcriptional regulator [Acidiphilium sp. MT5]